jgi:signal-transduction protein with cAMP-binding, CBS, and nucleotidyltransferase domain
VTIDEALSDSPWVADDLRHRADRLQTLTGAMLGSIGERLDSSLRSMVTDQMEVRVFASHQEMIVEGGQVAGLYILGGGHIELLGDSGEVTDTLYPGDVLFAQNLMMASPAPQGARAAEGGALVLYATLHRAHELMTSLPPLLEALVD